MNVRESGVRTITIREFDGLKKEGLFASLAEMTNLSTLYVSFSSMRKYFEEFVWLMVMNPSLTIFSSESSLDYSDGNRAFPFYVSLRDDDHLVKIGSHCDFKDWDDLADWDFYEYDELGKFAKLLTKIAEANVKVLFPEKDHMKRLLLNMLSKVVLNEPLQRLVINLVKSMPEGIIYVD